MLKRASDIIAHGDERAIVDFAIESNRELATIGRELELAKGHLRKVALGRAGDGTEGPVEIEGNLGVASVAFGPAGVKTRKGRDLRDIEANLSEDTFRRLFTRKLQVHPHKDLATLVASVEGSERDVIDQFLAIKPSTPKVFLPR